MDSQTISKFRGSDKIKRATDELIGLCRGILIDNKVTQQEAEFLQSWLNANAANYDVYPFNILLPRLNQMLSDNHLDNEESIELLEILQNVLGYPIHQVDLETGEVDTQHNAVTSGAMPYTHDSLPENISDLIITLTGEFECARRADVTSKLEQLGAKITKSPSSKTNLLIIGGLGSKDWKHSAFGRKIQKAIEINDKGGNIAITGEPHLTQATWWQSKE